MEWLELGGGGRWGPCPPAQKPSKGVAPTARGGQSRRGDNDWERGVGKDMPWHVARLVGSQQGEKTGKKETEAES